MMWLHMEVYYVLSLVLKNRKTLVVITFPPGCILEPEIITQSLSVPFKGTFCVYIECLIVISSKITIDRKSRKLRLSLACWFEQMMELEDAFFKEAPTTNRRMMELSKNELLEVFSMLWMMATDDHLQ